MHMAPRVTDHPLFAGETSTSDQIIVAALPWIRIGIDAERRQAFTYLILLKIFIVAVFDIIFAEFCSKTSYGRTPSHQQVSFDTLVNVN